MGLFGRRKTTIGLDIGSGLIKVAVIDHGRGEPELTKVAIAPLLAAMAASELRRAGAGAADDSSAGATLSDTPARITSSALISATRRNSRS